jgi:hypothetical protein
MARKKPTLTLRRPAETIDPLQAERFVHGPRALPAPTEDQPNRRPGDQTSGRTDVLATLPLATPEPKAPSKSLVYRKRTDDHRRRMTIYLPEDLSRRLRLYAAEKDQDYSLVLAEALDALLERKGVR